MTDAAVTIEQVELPLTAPDTALIPDVEPLPPLVITADALDRFTKFNPAARDIMREFEAAQFLWDKLRELCDDEETRQDTFDGETKLDTLIHGFCVEIVELETVAPGIDAMIAKLRERKVAAEKAIEVRKTLINAAMVMANWVGKDEKGKSKSLKLDIATITTREATEQVDYVDETKIPAAWYKRPDPVLDKAGLKAQVMGRHKAMKAALAMPDDNERGAALAAVERDFGPEIPGVEVKRNGYTTTITFK